MARLPMRNLWFSSAAFLLLIAACSNPYRNLQQAESGNLQKLISPFEDIDKALLLKASMTRNGDYYSGLILIKKTGSSTFRIVMTNELGPKIFDFELAPDDFVVHQCMDAMNRKIVLNMIEKDLRLVLMPGMQTSKQLHLQDSEKLYDIYQVKAKKGTNYYYIEPKTGNLVKAENVSSGKKKVQVDYLQYKNGLPTKIDVTHFGVNLKLQFELAER